MSCCRRPRRLCRSTTGSSGCLMAGRWAWRWHRTSGWTRRRGPDLGVEKNERLNAQAEAAASTTVADAIDGKKAKKGKATKQYVTDRQELRYKLYNWRPDDETKNALSAEHMKYIEGHARANQRAVAVAQEAAIFLLLIRKEVRVQIAPLQASFGAMLGLKPDKKLALADPEANGNGVDGELDDPDFDPEYDEIGGALEEALA